jgi:hypothetical protein
MAQFFKWIRSFFTKNTQPTLLSSDVEFLKKEIEKEMRLLVALRSEMSWQHLLNIIAMAETVQILEVNRMRSGPDVGYELSNHQGRIAAFRDIKLAVERAMDDRLVAAQEKKMGPVQGARRIVKQAGSFAGPAL